MYEVRQGVFRTPGGRPAEMYYREDTSDWNTLNSCMTEDEYELANESPTGLAIDIGAHIGGVGIGLALDHPGLRVVMVEPVPSNAALIRDNINLNAMNARCTLIEAPAGDGGDLVVSFGYSGTELATHHAFIGNASLVKDDRGEAPHEEVRMRSYTLEELSHGEPVDLLKIDCEGGEWDTLRGPALARCAVIVGEWHPVKGHTQGDMLARLGKTHTVVFTGPQGGPGGFRAVRR
jgi:FkbM family methyltransferase